MNARTIAYVSLIALLALTAVAAVSVSGGATPVADDDGFDVEIDDTNAPISEGQSLQVNVSVENTGTAEILEEITLAVDGEGEVDSTTETLSPGESTDVKLVWDTSKGDAGDRTLTVASDTDSTSTEVEILAPYFEVEIKERTSPVIENETIGVLTEVTNTGDPGQAEVNLTRATDNEEDSITFELDTDESREIELAWDTHEDAATQSYTLTAQSPYSSDSTDVIVHEKPEFDVEIVDMDDGITEGELLTVETDVTNTGHVADSQLIGLDIDNHTYDLREVAVEPDDTQTIELEWLSGSNETAGNESITHEVNVTSPALYDTDEIQVNETGEDIFEVELPSDEPVPVSQGGSTKMGAYVTNTGENETTADVNATVGGEVIDTNETTLAPEEEVFVVLEVETDLDDSGIIQGMVTAGEKDASREEFEILVIDDPEGAGTPDNESYKASPNYVHGYEVEGVWPDLDAANNVIVRTQDGQGIEGLDVEFSMTFGGETYTHTTETDAYGVASLHTGEDDFLSISQSIDIRVDGQAYTSTRGPSIRLGHAARSFVRPDSDRIDFQDDWNEDTVDKDKPPIPEPAGSIPEEEAPVRYGNTYYGVDAHDIFQFWSLNENWWDDGFDMGDFNVSEDIELDDLSGLNETIDEEKSPDEYEDYTNAEKTIEMRAQAAQSDFVNQTRPPVQTWNENNWDTFKQEAESELNRYRSHIPDEEGATETGTIKGAHATIFDVDDTTRIFESAAQIPRYAPRQGTLHGFTDFAVEVRDTETFDCGEGCETRVRWEYVNHRVRSTCLHETGKTGTCEDEWDLLDVDYSTFGSVDQFSEFSYEIPEDQTSMSLTYRANVTETQRWFQETRTRDEDGSWGDWELEDIGTQTTYQYVTDGVTLSVTDVDMGVEIDRVEFPDGTVEFRLNMDAAEMGKDLPPAAWSGVYINGMRIDSGWGYVTWREPMWDTMTAASALQSGSGGTEYEPLATPLYTNVIPTGEPSPAYPNAEPNVILDTSGGTTFSSPESQIPDTVDVNVRSDEDDLYEPTRELVVRHGDFGDGTLSDEVDVGNNDLEFETGDYDSSSVTVSDIDVEPFMPNMQVEVEGVSDRTAKATELQAEIVEDESEGKNVIEVTLVDGEGDPVTTDEAHHGSIWVDGEKQVNTDSSGEVVIDIPDGARGGVHLHYAQEDWYELPTTSVTVYENSSTVVDIDHRPDVVGFFFYVFEVLFIPALVIGLVYGWLRRDVFFRYI